MLHFIRILYFMFSSDSLPHPSHVFDIYNQAVGCSVRTIWSKQKMKRCAKKIRCVKLLLESKEPTYNEYVIANYVPLIQFCFK